MGRDEARRAVIARGYEAIAEPGAIRKTLYRDTGDACEVVLFLSDGHTITLSAGYDQGVERA